MSKKKELLRTTTTMKTIHIYSDESRHKNERFLLLGGLWIEEVNLQVSEDKIRALRKKYGYTNSAGKRIDFLGEFKWTKVSNKYLPVYKELADLFFEFIEGGYHALMHYAGGHAKPGSCEPQQYQERGLLQTAISAVFP